MTKNRQDAIEMLKNMPEDKIIFIIQMMEAIQETHDDDTSQRKEAFEHLQNMRKKVIDLDYDNELAAYREEKYGNAGIG